MLLLKKSQIEKVQNLGFLVNKAGFFRKKTKAANQGLVYSKNVSSGIFVWDSSKPSINGFFFGKIDRFFFENVLESFQNR